MSRSKVCIIYTGGTIGMSRTENGFAPIRGVLNEQIKGMRDMESEEMPEWDLIEFDTLLDSSDLNYTNWNQMAAAIEENYNKYDGFVVLHGTDTMAYSASALSFMLKGLNKPVVFTGSQIPLSELRSDGKDNLITSVMIAGDGVVREVSLYFGNKLMRGNRATKYSADELIAFESPDYHLLATAGITIEYNKKMLREKHADVEDRLTVRYMKEARLGVIKLFPGIQFSLFKPIVDARPDGIILEAFGAGNIPSTDPEIAEFITEANDAGAVITVCTQCPQGRVSLGAYEAGSALIKAGAISGFDMTTEAATTKLQYLLSCGFSKEKICSLMQTDIRGEMSVK